MRNKIVVNIVSLLIITLILLMRPSLELTPLTLNNSDILYYEEVSLLNNEENSHENHLAGIDVSHYQGKIDWESVAEQDIHFVYIKATDGNTFIDPRYQYNQESVIKQSIPSGAYHFFEPHDDGVKQAENFLAQVKIHDNMLAPVLDIEISKGIKKELLQKRVRQWIETVEQKTGCQPVIYSYGDFYTEYLGDAFSKYRFWLADYAKKPTLPNGVKQWSIWQKSQSAHVKGVKGMVSKDFFKGNKNQLTATKCKGKA